MPQVLVIVAASHLDAVTFQICSQSFKIMPTAVFAVWLLGQYLTPMQWSSLPVLAFGVVFVTMNGSSATHDGESTSDQVLLGLGASALSGLSSAYAGRGTKKVLPLFSLQGKCLILGEAEIRAALSYSAMGSLRVDTGIIQPQASSWSVHT